MFIQPTTVIRETKVIKKIVNCYYGRLGCHSCIFGFQTGNKLCYLDGLLLVSELVSSAIGGGFRFLGMAPNDL